MMMNEFKIKAVCNEMDKLGIKEMRIDTKGKKKQYLQWY